MSQRKGYPTITEARPGPQGLFRDLTPRLFGWEAVKGHLWDPLKEAEEDGSTSAPALWLLLPAFERQLLTGNLNAVFSFRRARLARLGLPDLEVQADGLTAFPARLKRLAISVHRVALCRREGHALPPRGPPLVILPGVPQPAAA